MEGGVTAVTNKEKAELMAITFVKVHSSDNLSEKGKRARCITKVEKREVLSLQFNLDGDENAPFTIDEFRRIMCVQMHQGKMKSMIQHLIRRGPIKLLSLYNRVEGR